MNGAGSDSGMKHLIIKMHMAKKGNKKLKKTALELMTLLKARRIVPGMNMDNVKKKTRKARKFTKRKATIISRKFKGLKKAVVSSVKGKK